MAESAISELIGNRYQLLDKLGAGGMGIVYRAADRLTGQVVALKQVISASADPRKATIILSDSDTGVQLALAQEFRTLASLRHPNIISVLDYGFDQERKAYFTMDLLEGAVSIIDAAQGLPLAQKLDLLIQVLHALTYLHRRAILHLDLKPANVMVTDGKVKVLDFGLSAGRGERHEDTSGTLAYMAPEVISPDLLAGAPISDSADLYAVGIIAYEMLAGRHPFDVENLAQLMYDVTNTEPDFSILQLALSNQTDGFEDPAGAIDELVYVVRRLLYKDPMNRHQRAEEVIDHLEAILGCPSSASDAIRESFLQAAQFVGRSNELSELSDAMEQAMQGHGSVWLVGGESGVGKSRLLDELRTVALVKGALVLRGQTLREAASPYQQWIDPLRRLVLASEITTSEAAVLKSIVPDIDTLLGRPIPDAPPLDAREAQRRLLNTIAYTFGKTPQPILLILEDLHWAENLEIFKMLVPWTKNHAVLIVGSYRNDEKPDLPQQVPGAQLIALDRLTRNEIAALSLAMIGDSGQNEEVVDLLQRETEGNVLFLVEVVRALAQQAGELERIKDIELPKQVFAGGVRAIIEHRLERVPAWCWPLLKMAAVMARELDLKVLGSVDPALDLNRWLMTCAQAAVVEVQDDSWRFVHSKLRDGVLGNIAADERKSLHYDAALAIERYYANAPEYSVALAYHFENAEVYEEAVDYWRKAADDAARVYANEQAMSYYRHAITLAANNEIEPDILAHACEGLGDTLMWLGDYQAAVDSYNDGLIWAGPKLSAFRRTVLNRKKGYIFEKWGRYDRAELCFEAALLNVLEIANSEELAHIYCGLSLIECRRDHPGEATVLGSLALTLGERLKQTRVIAKASNTLGMIAFNQGAFDDTLAFYQRSLDAFDAIHDADGLSSVHNNLGVLYQRLGDPERALMHYKRCIELCEKISNRHGIARASDNLARLYREQARHELAMDSLERAVGILAEIGMDDTRVYFLMWVSGVWQ